jgi:hypothetical protein
MPTATTVPAVANTAIAHSDMVFPGNLSDYDTNASSFTLLVNITLAQLSPCDLCTYKAYVAMNGDSYASIDWSTHSTCPDTSATAICPATFTAKCPPLTHVVTIPFILDSGANCHISPKRGDFKLLNPIPPLTVKGFGGSSIQAVGMGTIEVHMASRLCLCHCC